MASDSPHRREPSPFLGREWELRRLIEDLEAGRPLLTITGLSGVGKSRLAHAAAAAIAPRYEGEGGIRICCLEDCASGAEIEAAIAGAMGIAHRAPGGLAPLLAERGRTLLILDNGERLAPALAALLEPWLQRCPKLQIVVTSIVPLAIEGEDRHELGPLDPADAISLFEVGWPGGGQVQPEAALKRLYFGIWSLRRLGLRGVLLNGTDGYLLDPGVPLEIVVAD